MADTLAALPTGELNIAVDIEGKELGSTGPVYIVIVHDYKADHRYLVDVNLLQLEAFDTCGPVNKTSFRSILERRDIPKLFYDVRQDSCALCHQFGVQLDGILDVQL
jgi:exonuclease 3'-5' domain-containing protein 1